MCDLMLSARLLIHRPRGTRQRVAANAASGGWPLVWQIVGRESSSPVHRGSSAEPHGRLSYGQSVSITVPYRFNVSMFTFALEPDVA
jgi:hypothetical protein